MKKNRHELEPRQDERQRVLARTLASEELAVVAAGSGPTGVITAGSPRDITNLDGDNDGPVPVGC